MQSEKKPFITFMTPFKEHITLVMPVVDVGQGILYILCNSKVHSCGQSSLPLVPNLSQMNAVHLLPSCFFKIHCNIYLSMPRPS